MRTHCERAYAARTVLSYPTQMHTLIREGYDLATLKTIGKDLAAKITDGRLLGLREAYPLDMEKIIHTCAEHHTILGVMELMKYLKRRH